jgi:hypothetical protein
MLKSTLSLPAFDLQKFLMVDSNFCILLLMGLQDEKRRKDDQGSGLYS